MEWNDKEKEKDRGLRLFHISTSFPQSYPHNVRSVRPWSCQQEQKRHRHDRRCLCLTESDVLSREYRSPRRVRHDGHWSYIQPQIGYSPSPRGEGVTVGDGWGANLTSLSIIQRVRHDGHWSHIQPQIGMNRPYVVGNQSWFQIGSTKALPYEEFLIPHS